MDLEELPGLIAELETRQSVSLQDMPRFLMTIGWLSKLGICAYQPPPD